MLEMLGPVRRETIDHCERLNLLEDILRRLLAHRLPSGEPVMTREWALAWIDRGFRWFEAVGLGPRAFGLYRAYLRGVVDGAAEGNLQRMYLDLMREVDRVFEANARRWPGAAGESSAPAAEEAA